MHFVKAYLDKQNFTPYITGQPHADLFICLAIPCFNEPNLINTLQAIWYCNRPQKAVEVIVVINSSESASDKTITQNNSSLSKARDWAESHFDAKLKFHILSFPNLPEKHAGVGLARKIAMDEAVCRFLQVNCPKGIIAGFDADASCDTNYLVEMERHFMQEPKTDGSSIYFEHPTNGEEFSHSIYKSIIQYELHLRYMNVALRYAGHPHAFHTVGSSFAVRVDAYVKQGGMNKRQAGEDFYFLQKIISLGSFTEINSTRVIPSPRESDRVPFGTGAAMQLMQASADNQLTTYSLQSYLDIKMLLEHINNLYKADKELINNIFLKLSAALQNFLIENNFADELASIQSNAATIATFRDRFFRWFNVFKTIKYLNYSNSTYYTKYYVCNEADALLHLLNQQHVVSDYELLNAYRKLERAGVELI